MDVFKMYYHLLYSCLPPLRAKHTCKHTYACYAAAVVSITIHQVVAVVFELAVSVTEVQCW